MNRKRFGGIRVVDGRMDGWMDDFKPYFSHTRTKKGCVQWNPAYGRKDDRLKRVSIPEQLDRQANA